ncbi:hypothetical protein [Spirosoma oryzicola]|uniref:hypothetical protein n=1 Tax=Spirosoma oryzicola TaxID=2898794 RepID=UPI001E3738F3|nr:hypothetical protein [Spirosoma oryzicola]UHG90090.1 hypothetical protein LQ777_17780 [Spirosoma oryzicola]
MQKLKLKLTANEMKVIFTFCTDAQVRIGVPQYRQQGSLTSIILAEHYERSRSHWLRWSGRPVNKEFSYSMPISLAFALHTELHLNAWLSDIQRLLDKLNQALVNAHVQPQTLEYHD